MKPSVMVAGLALGLVIGSQSLKAEEIIDRDLGPAAWISKIDDETKCDVSRDDGLISISSVGSATLRIEVGLFDQSVVMDRRTSPLTVSFRNAKARPDIVWSDVGHRDKISMYFDLSFELQKDLEAIQHFSRANIMEIDYEGETRKIPLVGSRAAMTMLSQCLRISAARRQAELTEFIEQLESGE